MRYFSVTPENDCSLWAVRCDGSAVAVHHTQGFAVAHALHQAGIERDAGRPAVVWLEDFPGHSMELARV